MKKVQAITDGSCLGNPGRGGWACILRFGKHKKEMYGSDPDTTNNRMELMAAIQALRALKEPCEVEMVTDSQYVMNGVKSWMAGWKRNGWKTAAKKPVLNQDLWVELDEQVARHKLTWTWTKGHADHEDNNRCDELAREAAAAQSFQG
jgi:ribonuclease HI